MRAARAALLGAAVLGVGLLLLIAANQARWGSVRLVRFREVTLAIELALLLFIALRRHPARALAGWGSRIERSLASPVFFRVAAAVMLALFVLAALTHQWAFRTSSHDFSMIDEALDRSRHGPFLYSPVLGRSFLSEHFSPVLALFVPLHALVRSPYLLLLIQPFALWASGVLLRGLMRREGVSDSIASLSCLIFWNHARMISTLDYLFHMECLLPSALFALYRLRRGAWPGYGLALLFALSIKEDVGLYLVGFGAYLALAERRRALGAATALVSLAWSLAALQFAIPAFAHGAPYAFAGRWAQWGVGWPGIVAGLPSHPLALARALLSGPNLVFFASVLCLPFATRWGWALVAAPWILNATSSFRPQASLSLYYGIPLLVFAALACTAALARGTLVRRVPRDRALALAALAVVLNVSDLSFPEVPRSRHAMLAALSGIPDSSAVQLMPCFYPVSGYDREKTLLLPGRALLAPYVVLRTDGTLWPFTPAEAESTVDAAVRSGRYEDLSRVAGFHLLRRVAR